MGDVIVYSGMSLNGKMSDENDDMSFLYDFIDPDFDKNYAEFYNSIDTIVFGMNTYKKIINELSPNKWPYGKEIKCYVYTNSKKGIENGIEFTNQEPIEFVERIKKESDKNIWLLGGGKVLETFMKHNLIDIYYLHMVPSIIGGGIRMFTESIKRMDFDFVSAENVGEIVRIVLKKRQKV